MFDTELYPQCAITLLQPRWTFLELKKKQRRRAAWTQTSWTLPNSCKTQKRIRKMKRETRDFQTEDRQSPSSQLIITRWKGNPVKKSTWRDNSKKDLKIWVSSCGIVIAYFAWLYGHYSRFVKPEWSDDSETFNKERNNSCSASQKELLHKFKEKCCLCRTKIFL